MNSLRTSLPVLRACRNAWTPVIPLHVRHFHPTKPTPNLINAALDASAGLIHGVHNVTYLPWVVSIPLTAVIVRTAVGLPLQFYTRINARRERDISPLLHSSRVMWEKVRKRRGENPIKYKQIAQRDFEHIRERWGVNSWYKLLNFAQVPVWISLMESLRGMCGNTNGLVPWLLSLIEPTKETTEETVQSLHLTVEPSLANEGALWFPDLLAGDPTGALPVLLTASILLNVNLGWKSASRLEISEMPKLQMYQTVFFSGLRVFIQVLAVNVGFSGWFYEMPTALMIYWITSTNVATLQTWLLEKYMFSRPPIPAYKAQYLKYQNVGDPFRLNLKTR
ncbi:uncharacterized protein N7484_003863 [Penicillium longicatenatum]|uniref:uncharacterized protein n=1 Tax=Penicillium longicatenatum TaxID=1561947 RepID=UPI0025465ED9|nr:uncharacterized protein N7484_003863 [Penicillium longicatenatum]KAJ5650140.1 hypothetical protein N7484_003863 [Penicillium longicatenatum]